MKQVLQDLKNGFTSIAEVPCPSMTQGRILIRSTRSLVSAGTERMLLDFGRAGWVGKARQQPEKVRAVLEKIRTDGVAATLQSVLNKLDEPLAMGYCNVGVALEVGAGVSRFSRGDRVVSNGKHAEVVSVPMNLCAKVPAAVSDDEAAFTVMGAIALQGIRLAQPTLGETIAVMGLGVVGLLTVQLLRANGCTVVATDFNRDRLALAQRFGVHPVDLAANEDPVAAAMALSCGRGVDGVIITATTTSDRPVHNAALMCRKRGRIVLVGTAGLKLSRSDFYEKELSFQVSCSYGPGRYDPNYEEKGHDYPVGFVRWTEQRNFEAVLDMLAQRRLDVAPLISHSFPIEEAEKAYNVLSSEPSALGVVLRYADAAARSESALREQTLKVVSDNNRARIRGRSARVAFIGAGNYASSTLIPAFKASGADLRVISANAGVGAAHAARKFSFAEVTTDTDSIFGNPEIDAIVISTRHDSHALLACKALASGKHVFVEKPLALTLEELAAIDNAHRAARASAAPILMVGFNRRFAPHVARLKALIDRISGPKSFVMTVNAGAIAATHWTQHTEIGGGRIIGEACHFIDLLRFLVGTRITVHHSASMEADTRDTVSIHLSFADGSIGTVHYFANGSKAFAKERLEVFAAGRILQLDNFRRLTGYGWPGFSKMHLWRQDKGQKGCAAAFLEAVVNGSSSPIPFDELMEVSRITIGISHSVR